MSGAITITQSQAPALLVFHLNPEVPRARILAEAPTPATIAACLGLQAIPPGSAEVVRLGDIAALGLRTFLESGHDVRAEALGPGSEVLDTLQGHILIVHGRIAEQGAVTLHPGAELVPLGAYPLATAASARLQTPEPERTVTLPPPNTPTARQRGRATVVFLLLALVVATLVLVMFGVPLWPI